MRKNRSNQTIGLKITSVLFFSSHHNVAKAKRGIHLDNYMCNGHALEKKVRKIKFQ